MIFLDERCCTLGFSVFDLPLDLDVLITGVTTLVEGPASSSDDDWDGLLVCFEVTDCFCDAVLVETAVPCFFFWKLFFNLSKSRFFSSALGLSSDDLNLYYK